MYVIKIRVSTVKIPGRGASEGQTTRGCFKGQRPRGRFTAPHPQGLSPSSDSAGKGTKVDSSFSCQDLHKSQRFWVWKTKSQATRGSNVSPQLQV